MAGSGGRGSTGHPSLCDSRYLVSDPAGHQVYYRPDAGILARGFQEPDESCLLWSWAVVRGSFHFAPEDTTEADNDKIGKALAAAVTRVVAMVNPDTGIVNDVIDVSEVLGLFHAASLTSAGRNVVSQNGLLL